MADFGDDLFDVFDEEFQSTTPIKVESEGRECNESPLPV